MKKNWKILLITSIVILLPVFAGMILWNRLPERLPTHWNAEGQIDGWSGKAFAVLGMPLILLAVQWFAALVTLTDPKHRNHSRKILQLIFWIIPLLSIALGLVTYFAAFGKDLRVEALIPMLLGLVFVVIGNYMPKCRQNYTVGIKLPWTLNNEENWNRTHRVAGRVWVVGGVLIMPSGFIDLVWVTLAIALLMVLIPTVYSYILHRKGI